MPQLILEVSGNVAERDSLPSILDELVRVFSGFETVDPAAVKAYCRVSQDWAMGLGAKPGFIHLQACVLAGREADLRGRMADGLYLALQSLFSASLSQGLAGVTLEVREMDRQTYRK